jgi:hypothetical protein
MGTMRILDETGDTTVTWDADDGASTTEARRVFDRQRRMGRIPFCRRHAVQKDAVQLHRFDPEVHEIIWLRPLQGG